ncbi:MAG: hypothetical protein LBT22_06285 [Peptococcaceae bacterium]|jgi:hypothetical protein|nr:hypothetical protein [Peptococcaceae bacterium]
MTKQRIIVIGLTGIFVFGLLIGGQFIYKKNWVEGDYIRQSQSIAGVEAAQLVTVNGAKALQVSLHDISDLRGVCLQLENLTGDLPIQLLDHRNDYLNQTLQDMQFALQEGIAQGNFTEMAAAIYQMGADANVAVGLTMDQQSLYLTLERDEAQLLEVISRNEAGKYLLSQGGVRP